MTERGPGYEQERRFVLLARVRLRRGYALGFKHKGSNET